MWDHCSPNIGKKYCGKPTSGRQGNVTVLPQLKSDVGQQSARGCEKNMLNILPREASGRTTASHCRKPMSDQCRNSAEFRNGNPMSSRRPPAVGNHTSEKYCWSPVGARGSPTVGFPLSVRDRIHSWINGQSTGEIKLSTNIWIHVSLEVSKIFSAVFIFWY